MLIVACYFAVSNPVAAKSPDRVKSEGSAVTVTRRPSTRGVVRGQCKGLSGKQLQSYFASFQAFFEELGNDFGGSTHSCVLKGLMTI